MRRNVIELKEKLCVGQRNEIYSYSYYNYNSYFYSYS